ncbi:RHS repeat-associated core domain-containing protein [Pseudomonas soli]|uniref:RHS repeat-associated core domain-containing protein n=1 Tax=Pseudomonas soli TaxID=1306993 RepID=A0AAJ5MIW2_9PSED|nr:RHS repeat-associated core domain-containing protein [Pseudomonas soli]UXZ44444.1 RHS repeat-associated core domain-containing protein [Pseudomonas soli]
MPHSTLLVAINANTSVIGVQADLGLNAVTYTAFGDQQGRSGAESVQGYNGQRYEPALSCYILGNGYRTFDPELMRFHSPDNLSPFSGGGINCYAYCAGDPVNSSDPSGHMRSVRTLLHLEPRYDLNKTKATDYAPETHKYAGWWMNSEANGWDAEMAIKLPRRLEKQTYYQRQSDLSDRAQSAVPGWYARQKLKSVTRKIQQTESRLKVLKDLLPTQAVQISSLIFSMTGRPPTYGRALEDPPAYGPSAPQANDAQRIHGLLLNDPPPAYVVRRASL